MLHCLGSKASVNGAEMAMVRNQPARRLLDYPRATESAGAKAVAKDQPSRGSLDSKASKSGGAKAVAKDRPSRLSLGYWRASKLSGARAVERADVAWS